ncbi:histidine kinase [Bacillus timonensis]|nr:histidine kinase [Bacillus timonensis]
MFWTIRRKLILFLMIATLIPGVVSITIIYHYTKESVKDRFIHNNQQLISRGKNDISSYLFEISQFPLSIYSNRPFMNVLEHGASSYIEQNQEEITRTLVSLYYTRREIEQIHLYIHEGKDSYTVYNTKLSSRGKYENVSAHQYYAQLMESPKHFIIEPTHLIYSYNDLSTIPNSFKVNVISFHIRLSEIPTSKFLGFLSVDINLSNIKSISERLYDKGTEDFFIIDQKGTYLYSSNPNVQNEKLETKWFQHIKENFNGGNSLEWQDDEFSGVLVYDRFTTPFEDYFVVKRIPFDVLYIDARKIAFISIIIGLLSLIMIVLTTIYVSVKFTAPIKRLIDNIKMIESGKLEVDFDSLGNDEFGLLGNHFKSMINRINHLITREYRLEIENKSNQLKVLQSQINPHFLYNAFQSIGTLSLKHKVPEIYSLLTSLSSIMRYSMNMEEDLVPLSKEINHVQAYLKLQKQRFEEKFDYELECDDEVSDVLVPKMILQPLVENYFKHGYKQDHEIGKVIIRCNPYNDKLIKIEVEDNGHGLSENEVIKINQKLQTSNDHSHLGENIGLSNINYRLQIYYGTSSQMKLKRSIGDGLLVELFIPNSIQVEVNKIENLTD